MIANASTKNTFPFFGNPASPFISSASRIPERMATYQVRVLRAVARALRDRPSSRGQKNKGSRSPFRPCVRPTPRRRQLRALTPPVRLLPRLPPADARCQEGGVSQVPGEGRRRRRPDKGCVVLDLGWGQSRLFSLSRLLRSGRRWRARWRTATSFPHMRSSNLPARAAPSRPASPLPSHSPPPLCSRNFLFTLSPISQCSSACTRSRSGPSTRWTT